MSSASGDFKLLQPIKFGTRTVKNRMTMSAMLCCLATRDGFVTNEQIDYYSERARGGIGAVTVEYTIIDNKASRQRAGQLAVYDDRFVDGLSRLAESIKAGGALVVLQIVHTGRQSHRLQIGMQPVAPSPVPLFGEMPRELTLDEIEEIEAAFAEAAGRAKEAGFDGVELHGGHGYLLSEFFSPFTNRRADKYGGSLENRARFGLETLKKVRGRAGNEFIVGYKINGDDYVPAGTTPDDATRFSKMMENAGLDYLTVTAGMQDASWHTVQPLFFEEGCLVHLAERIKREVTIPVGSVGSHNVETGERALREGKADYIVFGRALIADPELPNKLASDRAGDIRPCIRANNGCVSEMRIGLPIRCEVNPAVGREAEFKVIPAKVKKSVVVIGGGIAGMEAARLAAERGHKVTLLEKTERLGGHLLEAATPESMKSMKRLVDWSLNQVNNAPVKVRLNTEATPKLIQGLKPEVLIVATGADFIKLDVPGVNKTIVTMPDEVMSGRKTIGSRVVVVGSELVGCETALYIAEELKKKVILVDEMEEMLASVERHMKVVLTVRLENECVEIHNGWRVAEITDRGVICVDEKQQRHEIEADTVVSAIGLQMRSKSAEEFKGLAPEVYIIGNPFEASNIHSAFEGAWRAVLKT